jgi:uncharacterized RDD family membrane protein YckC
LNGTEHRITSATGVDVGLAIAGPGSRSYAFIIDWHIRVLLALAWFVTSALLIAGTVLITRKPSRDYVLVVFLPANPQTGRAGASRLPNPSFRMTRLLPAS